LNRTIYVLTAVATILLVPAVVAGIYGMNFRHMPELEWRLGYVGAVAAMIVLGAAMWFGINRFLRRH
jgi:magnesium transporter